MRRPCNTCPWRVDAPRNYWDPEHFHSIAQNCRDDGVHMMLCHKANNLPLGSKDPNAPICQGWVRVMGFEAVGVRIALTFDKISLAEVEDTGGPELFPSFEAMLKANKIKVTRRNRWTP